MASGALERSMPSVLVVDDDRDTRTGLTKLLREQGFDVVGDAADGRSAVELARTSEPEVILMDMRMPQLDGIDASKIIRSEHPAVQIVVFSAFGDEAIRREAENVGVHSYLVKGCPPSRSSARSSRRPRVTAAAIARPGLRRPARIDEDRAPAGGSD